MEWVKGIAGKVATGLIAAAVLAAAVSWVQMVPSSRLSVIHGLGKVSAWCAIVIVLPWLLMLVIARVARIGSNSAGMFLVGGMTILELGIGAYLLHWRVQGGATWVGVIACGIVAAAYNLLACDWIAERFE